MTQFDPRTLAVPEPFDLAATCGPVAWTTGRSPRHHWEAGRLTWVGWESEQIAWRQVEQAGPGTLNVQGSGNPELDDEWARSVLGIGVSLPRFTEPAIAVLAARYPGLRAYCDGSVFEGIITAIVGQSISVAAAAVTQAKLAALFPNQTAVGDLTMLPLPSAGQIAESSAAIIRTSGVTMRRAEAIVFAAQEAVAGNLPPDEWVREHPTEAVQELLKLPLVGRWTAESIVLWGLGAPDAHPTGDVALLRAARHVYDRPEMTLKDLDVLAERWKPARGLAARLLWTELFGPAPIS